MLIVHDLCKEEGRKGDEKTKKKILLKGKKKIISFHLAPYSDGPPRTCSVTVCSGAHGGEVLSVFTLSRETHECDFSINNAPLIIARLLKGEWQSFLSSRGV